MEKMSFGWLCLIDRSCRPQDPPICSRRYGAEMSGRLKCQGLNSGNVMNRGAEARSVPCPNFNLFHLDTHSLYLYHALAPRSRSTARAAACMCPLHFHSSSSSAADTDCAGRLRLRVDRPLVQPQLRGLVRVVSGDGGGDHLVPCAPPSPTRTLKLTTGSCATRPSTSPCSSRTGTRRAS